MKRKRGGLVPRRGSDPVPRPSCWRPKPSPPLDFDRQRQPLQPAPPTRYPAAPLPPLLGRESSSGRPRILPPRPASRASHPLARNPPRGGAAVGGSSEQSPLHRGGCFPGRNASPGTLGGHTAAPRAFARDWTQPGGKEERQGRAGEQCGRLATAARPGKCLCAATRRRTGRGPRPPITAQAPGGSRLGGDAPAAGVHWGELSARGRSPEIGERVRRSILGVALSPISSSEACCLLAHCRVEF